MNTTTIEQILLPIFLFICYFCTFCILFRLTQKEAEDVLKPEENLKFPLQSKVSKQQNQFNLCPVEVLKASCFEEQQSSPTWNLSTFPSKTQQNSKVATEIIDQLTTRQVGKLCRYLEISPKAYGVEKTLAFLKSEVKAKFRDNPELVIGLLGLMKCCSSSG